MRAELYSYFALKWIYYENKSYFCSFICHVFFGIL